MRKVIYIDDKKRAERYYEMAKEILSEANQQNDNNTTIKSKLIDKLPESNCIEELAKDIIQITLLLAADEGDLDTIKRLFVFNLVEDVNIIDNLGRTPLHLVAKACDNFWSSKSFQLCAEFLIRNGADLFAKDYEGNTPLHLATRGRNQPVVASLLEMDEFKPDSLILLNCKNNDGQTPLHIATASRKMFDLKIINTFIVAGARFTSDDKRHDIFGGTPYVNLKRLSNDEKIDQCYRSQLERILKNHEIERVRVLKNKSSFYEEARKTGRQEQVVEKKEDNAPGAN